MQQQYWHIKHAYTWDKWEKYFQYLWRKKFINHLNKKRRNKV